MFDNEPIKLHIEAEGAGVVTGIKKSYPKANGVTLLCVSSGVSGGVSKVINRFDNTLQSSIFADSFV